MLIRYCQEALRRAHYRQLDDGTWFAEIPGFEGVWANADTVEGTREELSEVLQEWLVLKLRAGDALPVIAGIDLTTAPVR